MASYANFPENIVLAIQANQQEGMPQSGRIAKIILNASAEDLRKTAFTKGMVNVNVFGKQTKLTSLEILVLITADAGDKRVFSQCVSMMGPRFLDALSLDTGVNNPVADITLLLHGCLVCARNMFTPGFDSIATAQVGVSMLKFYFRDIAFTEDGRIDSKDKEATLKSLVGDIALTMLTDADLITAKGTASQQATYVARFSQQIGALNAIMFQAAIEHATSKEQRKDRQAKIATILLDISVVALGAALATHVPPILAVIPATLGFVSSHIVPAIVGQRDYVSALQQSRAHMKAESAKAILKPAPGHPDGDVPLDLIQERNLYRDMYFIGWDIVADACAQNLRKP